MMHENSHLCHDVKIFLLFESSVNARHDDMTCKWLYMIESMFSYF